MGRIVLCRLPLSSLPATSSFKSPGLFQGLGKTAKKSSGTPSFRADLSSLSCGKEAPLRLQGESLLIAGLIQTRAEGSIQESWLGLITIFKGDSQSVSYLVLGPLNDTSVYKGLSSRDNTFSLLPTPSGGSRFALKSIKS